MAEGFSKPPAIVSFSFSIITKNRALIKGINLYRISVLSVFIEKNVKSLKRRKYKGFCVFLLYEIVAVLLKYEENKAKKG